MNKADLNLADLFCGGGGFSTGISQTCAVLAKRADVVAVNHWKPAAETYRRNHPEARVLCTGLDAVIPTDEVTGGRLNLLAASPECTHFSSARGGRPMSNQSRSSAWLILKWLQELYVESVVIENVQEFENWGPLGADGRPLKSMQGNLFEQFIASLRALGYNVEWRILNAANYGGATTRERLIIIARRGRNKRIIWPDPTHARMADLQTEMFEHKAKWRAAREIIDWTRPSQSIFTRKKPLVSTTLERIAAGLRKFGGKNAEPFLVVLRNHMGAQSLNEPMPTLTASGTHMALCQPFVLGQQSGSVPRSVEQPLPTIATDGAISLIQPFVLSMEHSRRNRSFVIPLNHGKGDHRVFDVENPMPTLTTVDAWGVVEPFMFNMQRGQDPYLSVNRPMPTITASSNDYGLVEPIIISYYGTQNVSSVNQPLPTITTRDRFGLVQFADGHYLDVHFRMLSYRELANAMGFPPEYDFAGTRDEKVKQIGNSVHVDLARALAMSALAA